jgi:phosphoadenosine phosphosulfate reductase
LLCCAPLLDGGPLAGKTALVSSFGADSAVLLDMVASIDRAIPVLFIDTGKLFAKTHAYRETLVLALQLGDVRVVRAEATRLAWRGPRGEGCSGCGL